MRPLAGLIAFVLAVGPVSARGQAEWDRSPHGAILCTWSILVIVKAVGDTCFADRKSEFDEFVEDAIEKLDTFIMQNSPATRADLERGKEHNRVQILSDPNLCNLSDRNVALQFYQRFRTQDVGALRKGLEESLSVPRKPVMNPCL